MPACNVPSRSPLPFFFIAPATTLIYTLSLHDALPIYDVTKPFDFEADAIFHLASPASPVGYRSEEHTSELQSLRHLVCRLLLEKKKTYQKRQKCQPATYLQEVLYQL